MKNTKIISGFPAIGKSHLFENNKDYIILDSDSSNFSRMEEGVRHPDFPQNYMSHVKKNMGKADYILVSSHDIVRKALKDNNIKYTLVYPSIDLKDEYIDRFKNRGNNEGFIDFIQYHWEIFIENIEEETFPKLIELNSGEFLSDILNQI